MTQLQDFQQAKGMLSGLAYRMLGSWHDAEDVLQEAYLRWTRVDRTRVAEPRRYLTRVVTRLALDTLRARQGRRESYVGEWLPEPVPAEPFDAVDTSDLSLALLHLLERLTPPQRAVYVLRTAFELPYEEIADILGRTVEDCRQLQSRAVKALDRKPPRFEPSPDEQRKLLLDFVAAARDGDLARLEGMLQESAVAWSDGGGHGHIARKSLVGRDRVALFWSRTMVKSAEFRVQPIDLLTGPAIDFTAHGIRFVFTAEFDGNQLSEIRVIGNPTKLAALTPPH